MSTLVVCEGCYYRRSRHVTDTYYCQGETYLQNCSFPEFFFWLCISFHLLFFLPDVIILILSRNNRELNCQNTQNGSKFQADSGLSETLTLLITVSARALVFHMSIPCDKTFLWVSIFFTL